MSTFQELLEKLGLKGHKETTENLGFSERMKKNVPYEKRKFAEVPEKRGADGDSSVRYGKHQRDDGKPGQRDFSMAAN